MSTITTAATAANTNNVIDFFEYKFTPHATTPDLGDSTHFAWKACRHTKYDLGQWQILG